MDLVGEPPVACMEGSIRRQRILYVWCHTGSHAFDNAIQSYRTTSKDLHIDIDYQR